MSDPRRYRSPGFYETVTYIDLDVGKDFVAGSMNVPQGRTNICSKPVLELKGSVMRRSSVSKGRTDVCIGLPALAVSTVVSGYDVNRGPTLNVKLTVVARKTVRRHLGVSVRSNRRC